MRTHSSKSQEKTLAPLSLIILTLFLLFIALLVPIITIENEVPKLDFPLSRLGYFWSNVIWFIPSLSFAVYSKLFGIKLGKSKPFWLTVTILPMQGFILDVLFAHRFFTFPNLNATVGLTFPGFNFETMNFSAKLPIEEAIFYVGGFLYAIMTYLFCRDHWLSRYTPEQVKLYPDAIKSPGIITPLILLCILSGIGFLAKALLSKSSSLIPEYYLFILFLGLGPVFFLAPAVHGRINWQALSMTIAVTAFLSIIWEVTMAMPYGWWGYKDHVMIGLFVKPWYNLPIEAVLVWIVVSFNAVYCYEAIEKRFS